MGKKNSWWPLFITNFLSVLNDNFLKNLICYVSVLWIAKEYQSIVIAGAGAAMVLPFILFSPYAGKLSKIKSKVRIAVLAKIAEIPIMMLALAGFLIENLYVTIAAMVLMGLQSAIFSPSKYGLIRDVGGKEGISYGTGMMEMLTFAGVLIGQVLAGKVSDIHEGMIWYIGGSMLFFAFVGYLVSLKIKVKESAPLERSDESINPVLFLIRSVKQAKETPGMNYIVLGLSTFWLIGALIQMNMYIHCPEKLGLSNTQTSYVMAGVAIAIGLGCWLAGILSKNNVQLGLIPIGGAGLSICTTAITILNPGGTLFTILIITAAFFAGIFKIPLNAWIQENIKGRKLGDMIAYNNLMVFVFILMASGIFGFSETFFNTRIVFLEIALLSWIITVVVILRIPGVWSMFKRFIGVQGNVDEKC